MEEASSWETQEDRHPSTLISIINMIELPERMGKLEEARPLGSHTSLQGVVVCCTIVFLAHRVQRVCHWHVAQPTARSVVRPGQNKHNSLVTDLLAKMTQAVLPATILKEWAAPSQRGVVVGAIGPAIGLAGR